MSTLETDDGWIPDPPAGSAGTSETAKPVFPNVEAWVVGYLAPHIRRRLGGSATWCPWWWKHAEAISRLTAMWSAWEYLRLQGALGMSTWWLHHADPHLAVLMSRDNGPFASCKPDRHTEVPPLPCEPAPPELWLGTAFSDPDTAGE